MEIVVVGAGVFGSWIALLAARAGHRVTLIDRFGPANERSSSGGESRIIRSAYAADRIYTAMARRSLQMWIEFLKEQKALDLFRRTGVLWMANAENSSLLQAQRIFEDLGIENLWLDARAIVGRFPQFQVAPQTTALFEPEAGALLAERCVQTVFDAAMRAGAHYEIATVRPPEGRSGRLRWVETTEGRRISAGLFVFAAGSWLPRLFPMLDRVIRPTRQEVFFFDAPEEMAQMPAWIDQTEPHIGYGFPDFGAGMKLGFHRLGPDFDPDCSSRGIEEHQISEAAEYVRRRFPAMRSAVLRSAQVCHYENTPSGDFLIDRHPEVENAWLVGGGSGHGFKHAPAIAECVLGSLNGVAPPEPFSLTANRGAARTRVL